MRRKVGLLLGPLFPGAALLAPTPAGLGAGAWRAAGLGAWMAAWWVNEAIPFPATALPPLVALPVLAAVGTSPWAVIAGFMVATAALSMWVSNTATAMIMLPNGVSMLDLVEERTGPGAGGRHFGVGLMLGIAYACSIGGVATLIGTSPNAFLAGFFAETYGVEIGFARWLAFGLPVTLVGLSLAHLVLTRWAFPVRMERNPGGGEFLRGEREALGPMTAPERRVAAVFVAVAAAWVTRPLLEAVIPDLSDAGIAVAGGSHSSCSWPPPPRCSGRRWCPGSVSGPCPDGRGRRDRRPAVVRIHSDGATPAMGRSNGEVMMSRWLRRLRGAVGMGLAWAAAWFGAGLVLLLIVGVGAADVPFPLGFGALGFLAGVTFSGVLGIVEGRRTFDQLSLPRFAGWGAVGGLLFSVLFVLAAALGGDTTPLEHLVVLAPVFSVAGAGSASGSLALARRAGAEERLGPGPAAGEENAELP